MRASAWCVAVVALVLGCREGSPPASPVAEDAAASAPEELPVLRGTSGSGAGVVIPLDGGLRRDR